MIGHADARTRFQCLHARMLGFTARHDNWSKLENVEQDASAFLCDISSRELYGPFTVIRKGKLISTDVWGESTPTYPYQLVYKENYDRKRLKIPEREFGTIVICTRNREFELFVNKETAEKLTSLFFKPAPSDLRARLGRKNGSHALRDGELGRRSSSLCASCADLLPAPKGNTAESKSSYAMTSYLRPWVMQHGRVIRLGSYLRLWATR